MTPNGLGLDTANRNFGFEPIPAGTQAVLVMKIRPGNIGLEGLLKRSSNGNSEALDCEFTVLGGEYDGRKLFDWITLNGTETGHATAGEISRAKLRAIFESVHGSIQPTTARQRARAGATLRSPVSTVRRSWRRLGSSAAASDRTAAATKTRT